MIQEVIADVEGGKQLSEAFGKHPEVFDKIFLALVAAGEVSGTLDESLRRVAAQQEKDAGMMSKIKGAMTYPIIVMVVILAVMLFMLFTVVPQVEKLYHDMKKSLPMLTEIMINSANFMIHFWWLLLAVIFIGIYFLRQYMHTENGIRTFDTLKLNAPLFKGMFLSLIHI